MKILSSIFLIYLWSGVFSLAWAEGFFADAGGAAFFPVAGDARDFDIGPGAIIGFGYDWPAFGVRGNLLLAGFDDTLPMGAGHSNVELLSINAMFRLYPLGLAGKGNEPLMPFVQAGYGSYYLIESSNAWGHADASGIGGLLGGGLQWRVAKEISLGIEGNTLFLGMLESWERLFNGEFENNAFSLILLSLGAKMVIHF